MITGMKFLPKHKTYICQQIAEFATPTEAGRAFAIEFEREFQPRIKQNGIEKYESWALERTKYYAYDPRAKKWQDLIISLRETWLADIESIPLCNRRVRIEELRKLYIRLAMRLRGGDVVGCVDADDLAKLSREARSVIDQISQETGQKVSKSEFTGKDGGPVEVDHTVKAGPALLALVRAIISVKDESAGEGG